MSQSFSSGVRRIALSQQASVPASAQYVTVSDLQKIVYDPSNLYGSLYRPTNPPQPVPPTQPQPTASQPTSALPTNVPSQLLALLAAIPIATDGRVITSEYHNSLRAVVLALASQLGVGLITPTVVLTLPPSFLADGNSNNWRITGGAAFRPEKTEAYGWFPLQLPDGARLQSLKVFGARGGTPTKFEVRIVRQEVKLDANSSTTGVTPTTLMAVDLKAITSPFSATTTTFLVSGINTAVTTATIEDYKTIDNLNYKYMLFAEIANGEGITAQINAIQISYEPGLAG